jgi:hypothetical protein
MSDVERPGEERALRWHELSTKLRLALARKLEGLYGGARDEAVFDSLAFDKQQALLILARRLQDLRLWEMVRRVQNLYGECGVGMHFSAWPLLASTLRRRGNFSTLFARHRNTTTGFIERGAGRRASLHFLRAGGVGVDGIWEAHFDLYNPWSSPLSAWRHLVHEKIRRETPDWRIVGASLGYLKEHSPSARGG